MVRHISILIILSQIFTLHTILHEVITAERMNKKFILEVKIIWQQHEFLYKKKDFNIL